MFIEFDYIRALDQARRIETISNEIKALAERQLATAIENISYTWTGDTSRIFISKCESLKSDITKEATDLQVIAGRLRGVAAIIKETEERAAAVVTTFGKV